jgi:hypothetical protein
MEDLIQVQLKIWGLVFLGEITAFNVADFGDLARGVSYLCAGAASLATGYYYIFKKK